MAGDEQNFMTPCEGGGYTERPSRPAASYDGFPIAQVLPNRREGRTTTMQWFLRGCPVCGGDLHDDVQDEGWMTCFLCARSVPRNTIRAVSPESQPAGPTLWTHSRYPGLLTPRLLARREAQGFDDGYARSAKATGDAPSSSTTVGMKR